jgi:hypothetical protein
VRRLESIDALLLFFSSVPLLTCLVFCFVAPRVLDLEAEEMDDDEDEDDDDEDEGSQAEVEVLSTYN